MKRVNFYREFVTEFPFVWDIFSVSAAFGITAVSFRPAAMDSCVDIPD